MSSEFDLVIRGGTLADGTGGEVREADVAVRHGRLVQVGEVTGAGREEIDARGKLVTPGFVDIHTHYDGHATWGNRLNPSSVHGVTTAVMGNCGVGFAPCKPEDRERLIHLMEGVEDIPEIVMTEGLPWAWESFPDYMDYLDGRRFDMDVAAQLPHAPLRVFVMGERGANREPATLDDIARMRSLAAEAMTAGALGFSTSRTLNHRASDGSHTPTLKAETEELVGIAMGLDDAGAGVLQVISDFDDEASEFGIIHRMAAASGRPLSLSLMQMAVDPQRWRRILDRIECANDEGLPIKAQVCGRPLGMLFGLDLSFHPFSFCPSYREIADLPLDRRVMEMRRPERRELILGEFPSRSWEPIARHIDKLNMMYEMDEAPEYEPRLEHSIAIRAAAAELPPAAFAYGRLLADDGKTIFYMPTANYDGQSIAAAETMLRHKDTVLGLGDGGAHSRIVCDASSTTYMLERWVKGSGGRSTLPLEDVIHALTGSTAAAVGLLDRGIIAPGYRADLNVIDMDKVHLHRPEVIYDLPGKGGRLHQRAEGYLATIVNGEITYRDGQATGALPGRLIRGAQSIAP